MAISMHLSWGLYVNGMLLGLRVLAHASFLPRDDKQSSIGESLNPAILPQHPSLQGSKNICQGSLMSSNVMTKRDDNETDDIRIGGVRILTSSVPIAAAAYSLEIFYNAILYNALTLWSTQPPQQMLSVTMGPLQLTMAVVFNDGVPQGIPWDFVRNFARNMMGVTALGFTGTYDMSYTRKRGLSLSPMGLGVEVRFRILWGV